MDRIPTPVLTQALDLILADTDGKRDYSNDGCCVHQVQHTATTFDLTVLLQDNRRVTYSFYYDEPNKDLHLKRKHYEVLQVGNTCTESVT